MKTAFFQPDIPTQPNDHKILGNVLPGADALAISEIAEQNQNLTVVVTPDTRSAFKCAFPFTKCEKRHFLIADFDINATPLPATIFTTQCASD